MPVHDTTLVHSMHREDHTHAESQMPDAKQMPNRSPSGHQLFLCISPVYIIQLHSNMYCGSRPAITYRTETAPFATCPRTERASPALRRGLPTDPG